MPYCDLCFFQNLWRIRGEDPFQYKALIRMRWSNLTREEVTTDLSHSYGIPYPC